MWVLAATVALASASAIVAWRADDQLYEPDILLAAFEDLPNDPERAQELARWIAEESIRALPIDELAGELPLGLGVLARPLVGVLEEAAVGVATRLVGTELFAQIWAEALPAVHEQFVLLIEGSDDGLLELQGQSVAIDLDEAILATYDLIAEAIPDIPDDSLFARITGIDTEGIKATIGDFLERALPDDLTGFALIDAAQVEEIQRLQRQLNLIFWLSLVTIVAAAAVAIWLAVKRPVAVAIVSVAALIGVVAGVLAVTAIEDAIVNALRAIPWEGDGPSITTLIDVWTAFSVIALLVVGGVGATRLLPRRGPAPGRHVPGDLNR